MLGNFTVSSIIPSKAEDEGEYCALRLTFRLEQDFVMEKITIKPMLVYEQIHGTYDRCR
jgi:hypothetical protein